MESILNNNVDTVAGRKPVYRKEEKRKSICPKVCEDDDVTPRDVFVVQGNYVLT